MQHNLAPVLNIFPKWRAHLRTGTAGDGSAFEVLEVPPPSGSDAASGLWVSRAGGVVLVGFDVHHWRVAGWDGEAGALELIQRVVTERVAVVSWWAGSRWCGADRLDAGERPVLPAWVASLGADRIRVRSWRGALDADVECGR